jgi:voltage-gated potassium channel
MSQPLLPQPRVQHPRVQQWDRYTGTILMVAAVAFLAAYAIPILNPRLDPDLVEICRVTTWVTWVLFTLDYFVRLAAAEDRRRYVLRHLLDLVIIALPLLRPLRVLRLVSLLRVLNRGAASTLRGRLAVYVAGGAVLLAFCGALAVLDAERGAPGSNIATFEDAFWWAIATPFWGWSPRPWLRGWWSGSPTPSRSRPRTCGPRSGTCTRSWTC